MPARSAPVKRSDSESRNFPVSRSFMISSDAFSKHAIWTAKMSPFFLPFMPALSYLSVGMFERATSKYKRTMRHRFPSLLQGAAFLALSRSFVSVLLSLTLWLCPYSPLLAQDEAQVFSGDEGPEPVSRSTPDHPATAYWKVSAT